MRAFLLAAWLLAGWPAWAAAPDEDGFRQCEAAIAAAQAGSRIPAMLLPAIARVESGRVDARGRVRPWPWTINYRGAGTFFDSKDEAMAAVHALQAKGDDLVDVGCMQVNLHYHPAAFPTLDDAFDPVANARYAARFLTALELELQTWPLATAAYHSRMQDRGEDYSRKVYGLPPVPRGQPGVAAPGAPWPPPGAQFAAFLPPEAMFGAFARPSSRR